MISLSPDAIAEVEELKKIKRIKNLAFNWNKSKTLQTRRVAVGPKMNSVSPLFQDPRGSFCTSSLCGVPS